MFNRAQWRSTKSRKRKPPAGSSQGRAKQNGAARRITRFARARISLIEYLRTTPGDTIGVGPMASRGDGRKSGIYDVSEKLHEA
jgi:hypothetical protein